MFLLICVCLGFCFFEIIVLYWFKFFGGGDFCFVIVVFFEFGKVGFVSGIDVSMGMLFFLFL